MQRQCRFHFLLKGEVFLCSWCAYNDYSVRYIDFVFFSYCKSVNLWPNLKILSKKNQSIYFIAFEYAFFFFYRYFIIIY
jgi:hypothetical protein